MTENENVENAALVPPAAVIETSAAPLNPDTPDTSDTPPTPDTPQPLSWWHRFTQAARAWLVAGWRVLTFRMPRWQGLDAHPLAVAAVLALGYLTVLGVQRGLISGQAEFYPRAWVEGWASQAVMLWLCWVVTRSVRDGDAPKASTANLFMAISVAGVLHALMESALLLMTHWWITPIAQWRDDVNWAFYIAMTGWLGLAQLRTLVGTAGHLLGRVLPLVLLPLSLWIALSLQPVVFWWESSAEPKPRYQGISLDDEVVFEQPALLARTLEAVQAPHADRVNLYSITYAPYASQDVFMNESRVVTETLEKRFGAQGHTVQLVLNPATGTTLPWAVPIALRKSIQRMAAVMDRDRDVLFLHLTSHGARSGELAVNAWPMSSEPVTPVLLRQWLDEAGIRWRVISISACYSGSWIDALVSDETLLMTAADADHTSYGCGSKSPLTFFGQAMYVDALASTWSFEAAHAQARQLIETREKEAGKTDGYSNPQLRMGTAIRPVLERLAEQQASLAK